MEEKVFYRVEHNETKQGVWYDFEGNFTGLIHNKYNFCKNKDLEMPFCKQTAGYLSVTDSLEDLYNWFPKEDIEKLSEFGYYVSRYKSSDYKHNGIHYLMNKENFKIWEY